MPEQVGRPFLIFVLGFVVLAASVPAVAGCGSRIGPTTAQNSYTITEPVTSLKIDNPVGDTEIDIRAARLNGEVDRHVDTSGQRKRWAIEWDGRDADASHDMTIVMADRRPGRNVELELRNRRRGGDRLRGGR